MRANLALHPPVVILPLPALDQMRLRVVLARRVSPPRMMLPALISPVVRFIARVVKALVAVPRRAVVGLRARAQHVLAVSGARPPPISFSARSDGPEE